MSTRLSVNINDETAAALVDLAARRGTTVTDIVRRATAVLTFFEDAKADGSVIQIANGNEITKVVIL